MKQPELGKKIADFRKQKGLTQEELVSQCKLSVRTLQRIESGEVTPRGYTLSSIFKILECNENDEGETQELHSGQAKTMNLEVFYSGLIDLFNLKKHTMKKLSVLSVLIIAVGLFVFNHNLKAQEGKSLQKALIGTWQICNESGEVPSLGIVRHKIFTDDSFIVFEVNKKDRTFMGDFVGNYKIVNDSEYVENIVLTLPQYSSFQYVVNRFKVEFKGDLMYLTGTDNQFKEVWKRVSE